MLAYGVGALKTKDGRLDPSNDYSELARLHAQLVGGSERALITDAGLYSQNFSAMRYPDLAMRPVLEKLRVMPVAKIALDQFLRTVSAGLEALGRAA